MFGLYLHTPFCLQRCRYCDFFTMPLLEEREHHFGPFLKALLRELEVWLPKVESRTLSTLFFGGGTPSLLSLEEMETILARIRQFFPLGEDVEVTLEVNPETVDLEKAKGFRDLGINRVSMGVQSLRQDDLELLGREHNVERALGCLADLRAAGFSNVSLDFIYGRPGQTVEDWSDELDAILALDIEHLSMYELILEPGTPMTRAVNKGELVLPSAEESLAMYRLVREKTAAAGFAWYEVSNYAKAGCVSRHNLENWRGAEYLGLGPGAHSLVYWSAYGERRANPRNLPMYLAKPGEAVWKPREKYDAFVESLLNGLRLREGMEVHSLETCYGEDVLLHLDSKRPSLEENGYLEAGKERWCLTPRGAELLDSILVYLEEGLSPELFSSRESL